MKVRFAIAPASRDVDPERFVALVDGLERMGFDGLWLSDIPVGTTLDLYVALGLAAGRTERLKLGANVVPFGHNPVVLAKALAQLDRLSSGRLLLMLVPGLGQPVERAALGLEGVDRGTLMDETMELLRRLWSGDPVDAVGRGYRLDGFRLPALPVQQPLELWLGGQGPRALERTGRLADGWLGASMTPDEVGRAVTTIREAAAAAEREFDPEHFGLSVAYARDEPDEAVLAALRTRRPDVDPSVLVPVGRDGVRRLVDTMTGLGVSKFVLRPSTSPDRTSVDDELAWLADVVLPLQT
jgi:probable F420-dependent oxidoreductase